MVIIDCISDLHGYYPKLEGGDLLIVAGDLTRSDKLVEYFKFFHWISNQPYKKRIVIAGNHDNWAQTDDILKIPTGDFEYLCDSNTEFEGLKIWGSPWTLAFEGMNPHCKAFTVETEEELAEKWTLIPDDIDILVTHSPPCGILDVAYCCSMHQITIHVGSQSLTKNIMRSKRSELHVFGHIHEAYGIENNRWGGISVNASHVNERYEPVNPPIRVIL